MKTTSRFLSLGLLALLGTASACRYGEVPAPGSDSEDNIRYGRSILQEKLGPNYRCPPPYKTYNASNLEKALNGAAPDYLGDTFVSLEKGICHWIANPEEEYLVEIYYLQNAPAASALFTKENESQGNCPLGDNCQKGVGFVFFIEREVYVKTIAYFPKTTPGERIYRLAEQVQQLIRRSR